MTVRRLLETALLAAAFVALATPASAAAACPCSLFSQLLQPEVTNLPAKDGREGDGPWSLELGVKVTVDAPMSLSAIRFFKDPLETGAHQGRIWTSAGTLLRQVDFTGETASGWQQQAFGSPVALQPGSAYVISVNVNAYYGTTWFALTNAAVSGPLRTVADGQNGVFAGAAEIFPASSFRSSNYFVDVEVIPSDPPPTVSATSPPGAGTATTVHPTANFSTRMDPATITNTSFTLTPTGGSPVPATVSYDAATRKATLKPNLPLAFATTYTARLDTTVAALDTQTLGSAVSWTFTTVDGMRINAGGSSYTSSTGAVFRADELFTGGGKYSSTSPITGTGDAALYQDERWGSFSYTIPVANGVYDMRLHFVELYYGTVVAGDCAGKRIFGIDVVDTAASPDLSGIDVCAAVGKNAALVKTISGVAVSDGTLDIQSVYGPIDDPELAALEIVPAAGSVVSDGTLDAAPTVTATTPNGGETGASALTDVRAAFSKPLDPATLTSTSFTLTPAGGSPVAATVAYDTAKTTATLTPSAPLAFGTTYTARLEPTIRSTSGTPLAAAVSWSFTTGDGIRINTGGSSYVSAAGERFLADTYATGGAVNALTRAISGTADPALYQNERWGKFFYKIPIANGTYDVRLHFVELYYGTAVAGSCVGKRVFGIDVLETEALPDIKDLDVCAAVGPNAALVKTVSGVSVADGFLNIESVYGTADDPELAAIEVVKAAAAPPPPVAPTVTKTTPLDKADGVAIGTTVTATFSRGMNSATITTASFTLSPPAGSPVAATVSYDGFTNTATLTPRARLAPGTTYTARLEPTITASDGAPLAAAVGWTFTTAGAVRINAGGPGLTTTTGLRFSADTSFSGGSTWASSATITGTSDPALYKNERWGKFSYAIGVANGTYDVRFHFVELYYGGSCAGKRIFGMDILDTPGVDIPATLDVCAAVGPNAALVRVVPGVTVSDGVLNVQSVYGSIDDPELAALEVVPAS